MFLSDFFQKSLYAGKNLRGTCLGIGLSPKNYEVKYLLCSSNGQGISKSTVDFTINASSVLSIEEVITLSVLRPVYPQNCIKLTVGMPIYSNNGLLLGSLADVEIQNQSAIRLISDSGERFPVLMAVASSDALLLKKEPLFPLGQRIDKPDQENDENKSKIVTKSVLKNAIKKGRLIRFTLSLPPFYLNGTLDSSKKPFSRT